MPLSVPHEQVLRHLRPSIAIKTGRLAKRVPVGPSKLGGTPDLPEGTKWPVMNDTPLAHLAQLNLSDLAPLDRSGFLPREGHLYFFLSLQDCFDSDSEGFPSVTGNYRVLYSDAPTAALRPTEMPEALLKYAEYLKEEDGYPRFGEQLLTQHPLEFAPYFTLPRSLTWDRQLLADKDRELDRIEQEVEKLTNVSPFTSNRVLGHGSLIEMTDYLSDDDLLLLQVHGHPLIGGDTTACFTIGPQQLAERDFGDVILDMEN